MNSWLCHRRIDFVSIHEFLSNPLQLVYQIMKKYRKKRGYTMYAQSGRNDDSCRQKRDWRIHFQTNTKKRIMKWEKCTEKNHSKNMTSSTPRHAFVYAARDTLLAPLQKRIHYKMESIIGARYDSFTHNHGKWMPLLAACLLARRKIYSAFLNDVFSMCSSRVFMNMYTKILWWRGTHTKNECILYY